jgi:hypothetical protein
MDFIALLYVFEFLWLGVEIISYFVRRKEEKTLDAKIIERLKLLENKIKELKP